MSGNKPPAGHVRLNCNVPKEMHRKLKVAAVVLGKPMGDILRHFIEHELDELLKRGFK